MQKGRGSNGVQLSIGVKEIVMEQGSWRKAQIERRRGEEQLLASMMEMEMLHMDQKRPRGAPMGSHTRIRNLRAQDVSNTGGNFVKVVGHPAQLGLASRYRKRCRWWYH